MKKTSYILVLLCLSLLSCNSVKPINGFGEKDKVCRKYNAEKDISYVTDLSNTTPILVKGKWRKKKPNTKIQISHCPAIENELGTVLELMISESKTGEWLGKSNERALSDIFYKLSSFWDKVTIKHKIIKTDNSASYYIYEVVEFEERRIELMGVKNKKYYRISTHNFDPNQYIAIEDLLIGIFATN